MTTTVAGRGRIIRDGSRNGQEIGTRVGRPDRGFAKAGLAAPIIFILLVVAQSMVKPTYSHIAMPISALAAWPGGWVQSANFFLSGALMAAFSIGLYLELRRGREGIVGPAFLLLSAVGLMMAGAFPWERATGGFVVPPGHIVGAVFAFLGAGAGLIALSRFSSSPWLSREWSTCR